MITRTRVQLVHNDSIPNGIDIQLSTIVPVDQRWQITRIIFADKGIGDGLSGGFQVDYGSGGSFEIVAAAYLLGSSIEFAINRIFTGDGSKRFRIIRVNNSIPAKEMFTMVEGFQRIGDL